MGNRCRPSGILLDILGTQEAGHRGDPVRKARIQGAPTPATPPTRCVSDHSEPQFLHLLSMLFTSQHT